MSSGSTNFPQSNSPSKRAKHSTRLAERAEKNTEIATRVQHKELQQLYQPPEVIEADTRRRIAERFVILYFVILIILTIGVPIYNLVAFRIGNHDQSLQIGLRDILQTYSAIVGPTLGFVIAYYFKSKNENQ
jgi:hypothetical protein